MNKVLILLTGLIFILNLVQCSGVQKPDPKVLACKTACDTTFENCVRKAINNAAKKAACETVKIKCNNDCEKK